MHKEVIHFILENIVHIFDIPQTLITDQGSSFMSHQVHEFAKSNGQAKVQQQDLDQANQEEN
jgi:hypothetical protein